MNQKPYKILIAEDSPTQQLKLSYFLEENGYIIQTASNGKLAVEMIADFLPDLIISDVVMPEMDGFELCSYVKNHPEFKDTPILLLTSLSDANDVIKGLSAGADNFIPKPFTNEGILEKIEETIKLNISKSFFNQNFD